MTTNRTNRKHATAADVAAAVALGTMDPTAIVAMDGQGDDESPETAERLTVQGPRLSTDEHECGIAGCRHGAAHTGPKQPDRQLKLQSPCGAVARMTASAYAASGGILCSHGDAFAPAERRTYNRKAA